MRNFLLSICTPYSKIIDPFYTNWNTYVSTQWLVVSLQGIAVKNYRSVRGYLNEFIAEGFIREQLVHGQFVPTLARKRDRGTMEFSLGFRETPGKHPGNTRQMLLEANIETCIEIYRSCDEDLPQCATCSAGPVHEEIQPFPHSRWL